MDWCDSTAFDLAEKLKHRELSSRELTESVFRRIEERENEINAYISVERDLALKLADRADRLFSKKEIRSPLQGIPMALKDNICTKDIRTTCGSRILEHYIPPYNATVVNHILEAGAVIIGKTNLDEFGMGSSTEKSIFGPTRNPHHRDYVAGGSSGGSAAAVAAGEAILALGSDTGGSIRTPAAFCGINGIKPTYGLVSRYGLVAYASSLDQIGGFGKSVRDCAMLLNVIRGYDHADSTSLRTEPADYLSALDQDRKSLTIGLPAEYFTEGLESAVKQKILQAIRLMESEGVRFQEISLPHTKFAVSTYYLIATSEASSNLARYDGIRYGFRWGKQEDDLISMYESTRSEGFGTEVKRRIMLGTYALSAGYYEAYYAKAKKVRTLIKMDFEKALEEVDCILAPVTPSTPFRLGERMKDPLRMYLEDIYTVSLNLAGLPGMAVNCGTVDGLPVAFQIIGKALDEETVLKTGYLYERIGESHSP
jgi:aspartyl-tRNA(Asn)/glutamyl-tRNA(Gln) amidotransferase subunit A